MDAVAVALIAAGGLDGSVLTVRAPLRARGPRALAATLGTSCPGRLARAAPLFFFGIARRASAFQVREPMCYQWFVFRGCAVALKSRLGCYGTYLPTVRYWYRSTGM